jgi:hypothetical protein
LSTVIEQVSVEAALNAGRPRAAATAAASDSR